MDIREPDFSSDNYYKILGVEPDASERTVKTAYRAWARKYHPDKDPSAEATSNFQKISNAYDVLGKPESRHEYDAFLRDTRVQGDDGGEQGNQGNDDEQFPGKANKSAEEAKSFYEEEFHEPYRAYYYEYEEARFTSFGCAYAEDLVAGVVSSKLLDRLSFQVGRIKVIFLLEFVIKKELFMFTAVTELVLHWVIIGCCITRLVNPMNIPVRIVGAVALWLANINLHWSYGHLRYPNFNTCCAYCGTTAEREASHEEFNYIRDVCSMCLHRDEKRRNQAFQFLLAFPVLFFNHLSAFVGALFCCIFMCMNNSQTTERDMGTYIIRTTSQVWSDEEIKDSAAGFGLFCFTALYPVIFGAPDGRLGPVVAVAFFFVNYHFYNSLLFRKSFFEYLCDCVTGTLFAVVLMPPAAD